MGSRTAEREIGFRSVPAASLRVSPASISRAVARAQRGDREGLRILYAQYADTVYGYVKSIVRDHHEAEDVTQQVFARLLVSIGSFDERGVPFSGWLLRLARNAAIDQLRVRRAVAVDASLEHVSSSAVGDGSEHDRKASLRAALESLPRAQREVVVLRHVAGLSPAEIAVRLGRSESAVKGLHHRGRVALRAELCRMDAAPLTMTRAA